MVVSRRIIIIVLILKASLKRQNHLILNLKQLIKKIVLSDIFKIYEVLNLSQAGRVCIFRSPPSPEKSVFGFKGGGGVRNERLMVYIKPREIKKIRKIIANICSPDYLGEIHKTKPANIQTSINP